MDYQYKIWFAGLAVFLLFLAIRHVIVSSELKKTKSHCIEEKNRIYEMRNKQEQEDEKFLAAYAWFVYRFGDEMRHFPITEASKKLTFEQSEELSWLFRSMRNSSPMFSEIPKPDEFTEFKKTPFTVEFTKRMMAFATRLSKTPVESLMFRHVVILERQRKIYMELTGGNYYEPESIYDLLVAHGYHDKINTGNEVAWK